MTRDEFRSLLQSPYDRARWLSALPAILPATQLFTQPQPIDFSSDIIQSALQLGRIPLAGDRSVAVLEIRVGGQVDLQRNRVGLRNVVARVIGTASADAVLAFFIGDAPDYRFSFAARTNAFSADGQLEQNETAPRRYTYLFGPNQPCRTALERLELLRSVGAQAELSHLIEAFKVEPLFKEFYREYGRVFDAVEARIRLTLPDKEPLRLFTQRLFNRLMFLAFVERKGWLRFAQRSDYLAALWNDYTARRRTSPQPGNFYTDRLAPLFFEGLNQPERPVDAVDPRFGSVPYLNGGLFEYAEDGTDQLPNLRVPDEAIALILDPESGLFSRYNFTVAESTPLEIQVAVDPEMLGKVFEELVTGRHEQGSYYTPKPIVAFMGRTALVEHLVDRCPSETRETVERFVHDEDASALRDSEAVHQALLTVTICDPACGSGAYLLGLLHELLDLRTRLFASRQKDPETAYQRRLQIIERNLYGVDKDAFAINIARLRLWLALAVEYEGSVPPPLPNLDFKIEVGDALAAPAPQDLFQRPAVIEFRDKKAAYLRAHGEEKARLRAELEKIRADLALWQEVDLAGHGFNWAVEFAEVFLPDRQERALLGDLSIREGARTSVQLGGFDIVVANPPYVRQELIKDQKGILKKRFPAVFSGVADLYIYFYARANELIRPGGVAAFISSNKWLRAGYGESLRRHLMDAHRFRLVMDFGELGVFDTAATDAAIFLWQRSPRENCATAWAVVKDLQECYSEGVRSHFVRVAVDVSADQFGIGKPRLASGASARLRGAMEKAGPRLGQLFGDLMFNGVKTGLNEAFVVSSAEREKLIQENRRSESIIVPFLEGDDVRRYEVECRRRFLLYVRWDTDIEHYPAIKSRLERFAPRLRKRDGVKDGGPCPWYALSRPRPEAQVHFSQPKIIYPDIGKSPRFTIESGGAFGSNTTYCIATLDWYLLGILNSTSVFQYLKGTCQLLGDEEEGGRLRFFGQYLETLPIPDASASDREVVGGLAQRAQSLHRERRALSEQFLRSIGLDPADSTSRNPLEQPWALAADDFAKRARKLHGRAPDMKLYEAARDQTASLTEQIAKVEAEIDARVATLYGLDAEDRRWAAQSAPTDGKETLFFDLLGTLKSRRAYFSLTDVQAAVNDGELSLGDETLKVYLSEATRKGLIHDAGRGWYSRLSEPLRLDPKPVQKLIRATKKALPLLDFCAWSTVQLNPWMQHLLAQPVAFLYVPREALESVGETLSEQGWEVAVNPGKQAVARVVRPGEKMVVLRPAHSKQPPAQDHVAAPEQVLVELLIETESLNLMDAGEARSAALSAIDTGRVQMAELKRFAQSKYLKWEEFESN